MKGKRKFSESKYMQNTVKLGRTLHLGNGSKMLHKKHFGFQKRDTRRTLLPTNDAKMLLGIS